MTTAKKAADFVKSFGRNGDTEILHVSKDEVKLFNAICGNKLTRNPHTGAMEAFNFFDVLPIAAAFIPGIGPLAAMGIAGLSKTASGLSEGKSLGDSLKGGLTSAALSGVGGALLGGAGGAAGDVATTAADKALQEGADQVIDQTATQALDAGVNAGVNSGINAGASVASAAPTVAKTVANTALNPEIAGEIASETAVQPSWWDRMTAFDTSKATDLNAIGDNISNYASNPLGKENMGKTFQLAMGVNDAMQPAPYKGAKDDYDPKKHPVKSYMQQDTNLGRYVGRSVGNPAFENMHFRQPSSPYYQFADGGPVFSDNVSADSTPGISAILPEIMRIMSSLTPDMIKRDSQMKYGEPQGYADGGPVANAGYGYSTNGYGSSMQGVPTGMMLNPIYSANGGYNAKRPLYETGENQYTNNPFARTKGDAKLVTPYVTDPRAGQQQQQTQGPQQYADSSAWVPNYQPSGFTPAQTPNWRSQLPFQYGVGNPSVAQYTQHPMQQGQQFANPMLQQALSWQPQAQPTAMPQTPVQAQTPAPAQTMPQASANMYNTANKPTHRVYVGTPRAGGRWVDQQYAEGGEVDPSMGGSEEETNDQIVMGAVQAIKAGGQDPQAQQAIMIFIQRFGEAALKDLVQRVSSMGAQPEQQGPIQGPDDGMADTVPAMIDGQQPAALSHGEHVIDAHTVSMLGNGNNEAGHNALDKFKERVRMASTGNPNQPNRINPQQVMPV